MWLGLRFSPDSRWVAGSGYAKVVEVFDTEEHKMLTSLRSVGCNRRSSFPQTTVSSIPSRHEKFDTTDWHRVDTTSDEEKLGPYDDVGISSSQGTLVTSVCKQRATWSSPASPTTSEKFRSDRTPPEDLGRGQLDRRRRLRSITLLPEKRACSTPKRASPLHPQR